MTTKRGRGRPKGSTIKSDAKYLDAVADLMVRNPDLKKTPAISQIVQKAFPEQHWPAAERRLLRKWNETAEERLEAARERQREERQSFSAADAVLTQSSEYRSATALANLAASLGPPPEIQALLDSPTVRFFREHHTEMQRIVDLVDPPYMRQIRKQSELIRLTQLAYGYL